MRPLKGYQLAEWVSKRRAGQKTQYRGIFHDVIGPRVARGVVQ
jgi:hypothetical protein